MIKEFKAFVLRGNVLDLAVAVIIGAAFGAVIDSLAKDVIMNLVAAVVGKPDFTRLTFTAGDGVVRYGSFLTAVVNFLIIAAALFLLIRGANRLMRPRGAPDEPPETRQCPYCLSAIPAEATRCPHCTSEVEPLPA
jgi:large conductance mechanosensitive channel